MANDDHTAQLIKGWNAWRRENPNIPAELSGANLSQAVGWRRS